MSLISEIQLTQTQADAMIAHSKGLYPIEACGYLSGSIADDHIKVATVHEMTNEDAAEDHFRFDPKEQFLVLKAARSAGHSLVGVYHSHPESPARLSQEDIRLLVDPNMVYIIVSLMDGGADMKAFRTMDGISIPIQLKITPV